MSTAVRCLYIVSLFSMSALYFYADVTGSAFWNGAGFAYCAAWTGSAVSRWIGESVARIHREARR